MILVSIVFLGIVLALTIKRPLWALGLIVSLTPTYLIRFEILNIPTTLLELMVGVFLLGVLATHFSRTSYEQIKKLGALNWAIIVLLVAALISAVISPEQVRAFGQFKAFFLEPVLFFYASLVVLKKPENLKIPLLMMLWSTTIISMIGIIQYWTHIWLPLRFWGYGEEIKRITSIFEYPNALALFLAPLFLFFLTLQVKGYKMMDRYVYAFGLVTMFVATLLTYSRGAWLGMFIGAAILILKLTGVALKKWLIGGLLALLILSPILGLRFKQTFRDGSSSERVELYKTAGEKILENPILGNGLFGFRNTLENSDYTGEILNYPHNIILNFWVEIGLVGMISFFLIMMLSLRRYWIKPNLFKLAVAMYLVVVLVHGLFDVPYFKNDLSLLFWFMLSIFYLQDR